MKLINIKDMLGPEEQALKDRIVNWPELAPGILCKIAIDCMNDIKEEKLPASAMTELRDFTKSLPKGPSWWELIRDFTKGKVDHFK